jgi:hypothetical protein
VPLVSTILVSRTQFTVGIHRSEKLHVVFRQRKPRLATVGGAWKL